MLPLIPALILLLLSPATAERLAREGRFPAPLTVVALRGGRQAAAPVGQNAIRRARFAIRSGKRYRSARAFVRIANRESRTPLSPLRKPSRDRDGPLAV